MKSIGIKIALVVLAAVFGFGLVRVRTQVSEQKQEIAVLEEKITKTKQERDQAAADVEAAETEDGLRDISRNKLGLVGAGEIIFQDVGN